MRNEPLLLCVIDPHVEVLDQLVAYVVGLLVVQEHLVVGLLGNNFSCIVCLLWTQQADRAAAPVNTGLAWSAGGAAHASLGAEKLLLFVVVNQEVLPRRLTYTSMSLVDMEGFTR